MSAFVGLDVHSESTYATVLGLDGRVVDQRKMPNEHVPGFLRLFKVERVGLEASTHVAPLYRTLVKKGYLVLVSHPKKTSYIAEARIKSDRVDSKGYCGVGEVAQVAAARRMLLCCYSVLKHQRPYRG